MVRSKVTNRLNAPEVLWSQIGTCVCYHPIWKIAFYFFYWNLPGTINLANKSIPWINYIMTTTKQSTAKPVCIFHGIYDTCRTSPDKMADILLEEQAHFLNNRGPNLGEGPARGITRQKESRWIIQKVAMKSRPIKCVDISRAVGNSIARNSEILVSALSCQGTFSLFPYGICVFWKIKIRLWCT